MGFDLISVKTELEKLAVKAAAGAGLLLLTNVALGWWEPIRAVLDEPTLNAEREVAAKARDSEIMERLTFLEDTMPPPPVVIWDHRQSYPVGDCGPDICYYSLYASRTEYGDSCGTPMEILVFIRSIKSSGTPSETTYHESFKPVELERSPKRFVVPIIRPRGLLAGEYEWRARVTYPSCPGRAEPTPRFTPWFSITLL